MSGKNQPKKQVNVDGVLYNVQYYPPSYGHRLWAKMVRLLGEPLIKLVGIFEGDAVKGKAFAEILEMNFSDLNIDAAGDALSMLFSNLKEDDFVPLLKEILSHTFMTVDGYVNDTVADQFDCDEFAGKYLHMMKLVGKTLGVQYPDFLSALGKRRSAGKGASASQPKAAQS